jgi:chromosome partitioning protein
MAESSLQTLLDNFKTVAEGGAVARPQARFKTYAITNFRGGIGKSTLAFNLSWEISRLRDTLLIDVCPQRNFTQSLLGEEIDSGNLSIYDALLPNVMAGNAPVAASDLLCAVPPYCTPFKGGKKVFVVPGSNDLFLFPSLLYTQLSTAAQLGPGRSKATIRNILNSLSSVIESLVKEAKIETTLIDTSPFFGGATHLAWVAADALVIPVRVDQHSMEALKLTLSMLKSPDMDFLRLNKMAGIEKVPKVHAIAMTHCGWNRQAAFTPDRSTQSYLSQVVEIAEDNSELFSCGDPIECIHILDDFHSAGRISGSKRIPLAKLNKGETHTIQGQKLEVNVSLDRYQNELKSLASSL